MTTVDKLKRLDLADSVDALPRNLVSCLRRAPGTDEICHQLLAVEPCRDVGAHLGFKDSPFLHPPHQARQAGRQERHQERQTQRDDDAERGHFLLLVSYRSS